MDRQFQDQIDDYLLHRMKEEDRDTFLHEVEQDETKREQLEFTKHVKDAICSREEKLKELTIFKQQYEQERKRSVKEVWLWISGIAAILLVGLFTVRYLFIDDSLPRYDREKEELIRGDDKLFERLAPADTTTKDTTLLQVEKEGIPHE